MLPYNIAECTLTFLGRFAGVFFGNVSASSSDPFTFLFFGTGGIFFLCWRGTSSSELSSSFAVTVDPEFDLETAVAVVVATVAASGTSSSATMPSPLVGSIGMARDATCRAEAPTPAPSGASSSEDKSELASSTLAGLALYSFFAVAGLFPPFLDRLG